MENTDLVLQNILSVITQHSLSDVDKWNSVELLIANIKWMIYETLKKSNIPIIITGNYSKSDYEDIKAEYQEKLVAFVINEEGYEAWIVDRDIPESYREFLGGLSK